MRVILLRHTESEANLKRVYGGRRDFKLTEKGIKQIEDLVEVLNNSYEISTLNNVRIYSSPLSRCKDFGKAIAKTINKELLCDKRLEEFDFGIFEGYTYEELSNNEFYKLWCEDYFNYEIPKGESLELFRKRVESFIKEILEKNSRDDLVIVAHEGVIKVILLYILKLPIENFWSFYCGNGSVVELIYENNFGYIKSLYNN